MNIQSDQSDYDTAVSEDEDKTIENIQLEDDFETNPYLVKLHNKDKNFIDLLYGVRLENDNYKIGRSSISFNKDVVVDDDIVLPKTIGLMEALFAKHPDYTQITPKGCTKL